MMKKDTYNVTENLNSFKLRVILESIFVGSIAGFIVSLYRLAAKYFQDISLNAYSFIETHKIYIILGIIVLSIIGYIVGTFIYKEPMIGGSGIPQIEGSLKGYFKILDPIKIVIYKFISGVMAMAPGLSLGIEGPSIQLGAGFGHILGNKLKRTKLEKRFLLSSGAGAGLAAAFNAPFAGVMFVMEEVHKSFSPLLFVSAIVSSVAADLVTWIFFGSQPILDVNKLINIPFEYYLLLILLGIVTGLGGIIYNRVLLKTINLYKKIKISIKFRMIIPFIFALIFGLCLPQVLGGGNALINNILLHGVAFKFAIILLIGKFIFSMISFAPGTPGGILFPTLTLGALVGFIFGEFSIFTFGISNEFLVNIILLSMAGMFASIVRAPITGFILVCEMSGSFNELGPIILVCGISYLVANLLGCPPVYESLLKLRIESNKDVMTKSTRNITIEYMVRMGSEIVGKKLKDIKLGKNSLIISIDREGEELIPNGDTEIRTGDLISILVNEKDESKVRINLENMCQKIVI